MLIFLQVTENHCARERCPTHSTVKIRIVQDCEAVSAIAEPLFKLMCILLNVLWTKSEKIISAAVTIM